MGLTWVREGTASADVLEELGLDPHADQPLFEWQSPGVAPAVPASLTFIGGGNSSGDPDITMPAGTQPGDLILIVVSESAFAPTPPVLADRRMTADFAGRTLIAHGYADFVQDPIAVTTSAGAGNANAWGVYRVTGGTAVVTLSSGTGVPVAPDVPAGAHAAALALVSGSGVYVDTTGEWTTDAEETGISTIASISSATEIASPAYGTGDYACAVVAYTDAVPLVTNETYYAPNADYSAGLVSYSLTYGRTDSLSKVQAVQISVVCAAVLAGAAPEIGDLFRISLKAAAADALGLTVEEAARFTGEVTDVVLDPGKGIWTVTGIGTLNRKARATLALRPAQTAHNRVLSILSSISGSTLLGTLLALSDDIGTVDPGPTLLAALEAPQTGAAALDAVADSTLAQTVQQLDGRIDWQGPEHRRGTISSLTLTAAEVLSDLSWSKHVGATVNVATVAYAGGSVTVRDPASIMARQAEYPVDVGTILVDEQDATALAVLIVGRYATPAWDLPTLVVDVTRSLDQAKLATFLRMRHSDRLEVTGLPAGGAVVGAAEFFLEGFSETAVRTAWRLGLSVTDPALSGVSVRWMDVDPGLSWSEVDPGIRWLDVAGMENPALLGSPGYDLDGGTSGSTSSRTIDGGTATAGVPARTIEGGLAA